MSLRSPKHKFSGCVTFKEYVPGIGQTVTVTGNSIEEVEHLTSEYRKNKCDICIKENKAEYPKFDWVVVKEYTLPVAELNNRTKIGIQLQSARNSAGLTIRQLADLSGVSSQNITKIEHGKYNVSIDILSKVTDALGATIEIVKPAE